MERDVVIVGGGISGLYCAMKLMELKKPKDDIRSITILEQSDRFGGRLDTDIIETKDDGVKCQIKEEEGAMRFTYQSDPESTSRSNMPLLSKLIKDLEMETEVRPFYMEPQKIPGSQNCVKVPNSNTCYFNGNHFTEWYAEKNPTLWKNLFNLEKNEEFKSAGEIVKDIYRKLLDHNKFKIQSHFPERADVILAQQDKEQLQEYEDTEYWAFVRNKFTWTLGMQEVPLNELSMQALLTTMGYSHGCCMMMVQTQGFLFASLSEGNVGSILQELMTFNIIGDNLHQFEEGWSSLVKKLKERLKNTSMKDGVELEFKKKCKVMMVNDNEEGFNLTIESQGEKASKTMNISAKNVVMALPPKAVEAIFNRSKYCNIDIDKVMKICKSVEGIHCTKINLYFNNDWWNQDDNILMYGPNVTSLPCGFVYPFYGECTKARCKGCEKCDDDPCPAALTIYCDVNNAQFWSSLQRLGHKFQSPLQNRKEKLLPASEPLVAEALEQFNKVFNINNIPHPILTSYRSWDGEKVFKTNSEEEYGYAIHMWGLGVDDIKVMKKVAQPIKQKNLYFCNEAWSGFQGWVEGSLMSTQNAVDKLLQLDSDD